jgi:hypothetical protein
MTIIDTPGLADVEGVFVESRTPGQIVVLSAY